MVAERAPRAVLCLDAFHVVAWASKALDEVRRGLAASLCRTGRAEQAASIKHTRWALLNNPGSLSADQRTTNTHLRLLTPAPTGYHSPESLIAMADLTRGGLCPPLPGRS